MAEDHPDDELKRLWRSVASEPSELLHKRAMGLRRANICRSSGEILLTVAAVMALAWKLPKSSNLVEVLTLCFLGFGAIVSQLWLFSLRRRLWNDIGLTPCGYWASACAKAELGLRIARLTYIGGPPSLLGGALLAHVVAPAEPPSLRLVGILSGGCVLLFLLGWRDARREHAKLIEAQATIRELGC